MKIEKIGLKGMLPGVFLSESIPGSDIWRSDVEFRRGEFYLVEATSGAGKSSMCSYIYGLRTDYEGTLLFDGKDASTLGIPEWQDLRRTSLAYLPQELSLFPDLTALENIRLKNNLTGYADEARIGEWLRMLGVDSRKDTPVGKMSVGQRQRVGIVRAICQPFDFLLLDEPVSHLDPSNNAIAAALVMEEARRQGAGIIATSVGNPLALENPVVLKL